MLNSSNEMGWGWRFYTDHEGFELTTHSLTGSTMLQQITDCLMRGLTAREEYYLTFSEINKIKSAYNDLQRGRITLEMMNEYLDATRLYFQQWETTFEAALEDLNTVVVNPNERDHIAAVTVCLNWWILIAKFDNSQRNPAALIQHMCEAVPQSLLEDEDEDEEDYDY